jgi:hypothetical protein
MIAGGWQTVACGIEVEASGSEVISGADFY